MASLPSFQLTAMLAFTGRKHAFSKKEVRTPIKFALFRDKQSWLFRQKFIHIFHIHLAL